MRGVRESIRMYAIQILVDQEYLYALDLFEVDEYGSHKPTLYSTKREAEVQASRAGWSNYRIVEYPDNITGHGGSCGV